MRLEKRLFVIPINHFSNPFNLYMCGYDQNTHFGFLKVKKKTLIQNRSKSLHSYRVSNLKQSKRFKGCAQTMAFKMQLRHHWPF